MQAIKFTDLQILSNVLSLHACFFFFLHFSDNLYTELLLCHKSKGLYQFHQLNLRARWRTQLKYQHWYQFSWICLTKHKEMKVLYWGTKQICLLRLNSVYCVYKASLWQQSLQYPHRTPQYRFSVAKSIKEILFYLTYLCS